MINRLNSMILVIVLGLIASFFVSNFPSAGRVRGFEKFMAYAQNHMPDFKYDEFAIPSVNNVITVVIAHTNDATRSMIYYGFFAFCLWGLWRIAKDVAANSAAATIFLLLCLYIPFNYTSFNVVLLPATFSGSFLAGPFVVLSLYFFLNQRYVLSGIMAAIGFYFHPGTGLWLVIALLSFIPVMLVTSKDRAKLRAYIQPVAVFILVFCLGILPRLLEAFVFKKATSIVDPTIGYNLLKYAWFSQTTLWLTILWGDIKTSAVILLSNLILLVLIVKEFRKEEDRRIHLVYQCYIGTLIFLVVNEVLIHVFDFRISVIYGLCRTAGFNYLFLLLLASCLIVRVWDRRNYSEGALWICFLVNYTLIHYKIYSGFLTVLLLGIILLIRNLPVTKVLDDRIRSWITLRPQATKRIVVGSLTAFVGLIALIGVLRYQKNLSNPVQTHDDRFATAIAYVNQNNIENKTVVFPFDKGEDFLFYSKRPGFFSDHYSLLLLDLYKYDPRIQKRAYDKFRKLEEEFGIDTLSVLKVDPTNYFVLWRKAWEDRVDKEFIRRWQTSYNFGYVIREKTLSPLPDPIVYENEKYFVYKIN